jgi:hypothetical protein
LLLAVAAGSAGAEERIADIRQGTNLAAALAPGGNTLVVGLLEQLWRPNVDPCMPGASTPLALPPTRHAPIGTPLPSALARVITSGVMPSC